VTTYPGSGILSQFYGPLAESTYGVAPSLTGAHFYAIKGGESLKSEKVTAQGEGLFSGALHPQAGRRVLTGWNCGGSIPMELPTRNLQQWLLPMFGSYGQTLATLTEDASTGAYKSVHAPGPLQTHSFVVQKGVPSVDGTVEPFTYVGCKISEWELSVAKNEIAQLNLTILARNELAGAGNSDPLNGSVPSLVSYSAPIGSVFHWAQAALYTGGTCSTTSGLTTVSAPVKTANVRNVSIKYTVPLDADRYEMGGQGFRAEPIDNGLRSIAVTFEIEWLSSEAMYNAYTADTPTALELTLIGPVIGSGSDASTLAILIPEMFFDGAPPTIEGPQVVTQKIEMAGLDDATNNVIQATYWTLDTA
jgi:Phage tail tube protein